MVRFRDVCQWVIDSVEESVSERSESPVMGFDGGRESVRSEPRGSRCTLTVGDSVIPLAVVEAKSSAALRLASRLVSKGVGVDGVRDSLVVQC